MPDEIIEELWRIKDDMAREHGQGVKKLVAHLQGSSPEDSPVSPDRSSVEVLEEAPGHLAFKTGEEDVESHVQDERA